MTTQDDLNKTSKPISITIPTMNGEDLSIELSVGNVFFMLGANGSGKSSLLYKLLHNLGIKNCVLMSAYRPNNLDDKAYKYNTQQYNEDKTHKKAFYTHTTIRYSLYPAQQAIENLFSIETLIRNSLNNATNLQQKIKIGEQVITSDALTEIDSLNSIFKKSGFVIELFLSKKQTLMAKNNAYSPPKEYSIAELSDGERAALMISSNILCAKSGSFIYLDEPERHLHRRLVSSLLSELIQLRKDCIFIISTHEIALPTYVHDSKVLLVRQCEYENDEPIRWDVDLINQHDERYSALEETLKVDLLGSRKIMLFVEGTSASLDIQLYQTLFPTVSVISKGSCEMVEQSVKGLRNNQGTHWVKAFGIIDNDNKAQKEIENLAKAYIFSLNVYSIESIFYHPKIIQWVLEYAKEFNDIKDIEMTYAKITQLMQDELSKQKDHLCGRSVNMKVRSEIMASLPKQTDIEQNIIYEKTVDIPSLLHKEYQLFDHYLETKNYDALMTHYPIREANLLNPIAKNCGFADRQRYEHNVILMIQKNNDAQKFILSLLGGASQAITAAIVRNDNNL
ncbi:AAA family ATPase [Commensalibacter papalotli (ex Servin-Garciduenas et al. 2014)]|uniref:ATPase AAA n=1 Tax=Commensalibacter papalotli (ex Servin-Garciduenas et al. 2014) TaxID=1208583 RepID=W7DPU8_9PROT|nr:AAA family ATPase [Commensalibacter papalotli (ex Servin-Garciduenas et al. 2014)]EUK19387.1 ATPase AAA [Commensalibacter papalotli (ex Servin-Garciduenas et al. 2014)]